MSGSELSVDGEDLDDLSYRDVKVLDRQSCTVQIKDGKVEVLVFDPNDPKDSVAEFEFDLPDMSWEEAEARAEIQAERRAQDRYERHLDDRGSHRFR